MKRPLLLWVDDPPKAFERLFAVARQAGFQVGWLQGLPEGTPLPTDLEQAAVGGALRAVAVGEGRTVVVKGRRGPAVLEDLLREHFRGARVVLVARHASPTGLRGGEVALPSLRPEGESGWVVEAVDGRRRTFTSEGWVRALRQPHPW